MTFDDVKRGLEKLSFPLVTERTAPDRSAVVQLRDLLKSAVRDDLFLLDAIELELNRLEMRNGRLAGLVPFHCDAATGITLSFGHWPPGMGPGPHEHLTWTITAVCRNEVEVVTYDYDATYRTGSLVPKNTFSAESGEVGYIYLPCVHSPVNRTSNWTLTIHLSGPHADPLKSGERLPFLTNSTIVDRKRSTHPYEFVANARTRMRMIGHLFDVLNTTSADTRRTENLQARCRALGSPRFRSRFPPISGGEAMQPRGKVLKRIHPGIVMEARRASDRVALLAQSPWEMIEELSVLSSAWAAIQFVADNGVLYESDIPGLTGEEQRELCDALQHIGLYTEVTDGT